MFLSLVHRQTDSWADGRTDRQTNVNMVHSLTVPLQSLLYYTYLYTTQIYPLFGRGDETVACQCSVVAAATICVSASEGWLAWGRYWLLTLVMAWLDGSRHALSMDWEVLKLIQLLFVWISKIYWKYKCCKQQTDEKPNTINPLREVWKEVQKTTTKMF